jgi:hypothetical protein
MRTTTIAGTDPDRTYVCMVDDCEVGADVRTDRSAARVVDIQFHIRGGHVTPAARAGLVEAVLDLPQVRRHRALRASVPIGDAELIEQLRRRCSRVHTRAAGSTCLIDAELR